MSLFRDLGSPIYKVALAGLVLLIVLAVAAAIVWTPAPHLNIEYSGETIQVFADRAWSLTPSDCLQISWIVNGEQTIHIEGIERHVSGSEQFCPAIFATSPKIELTDHLGGEYRSYNLQVRYLPDFIVNLLAVAALSIFPLAALYFLLFNDPHRRPAFSAFLLAFLSLVLCVSLVQLSVNPLETTDMLSLLGALFADLRWQAFGVVVSGVLFVPLAVGALWQGVRNRLIADFAVVFSFLLIVLLLYLPFGFATIAQWDEWTFRAYLENLPWPRLDAEMSTRFFLLVTSLLSFTINTESFVGFNLVHALSFWASIVILYGILRELHVRRLYALLISILFAVYPVNSGLMSLQSINLQFSSLCLLSAVLLALRYTSSSNRMHLLGIWIALAIYVGIYEAGYVLIALVPVLWWIRSRKVTWHNLSLTAIWYLIPTLKLVYLGLLLLVNQRFYWSDSVVSAADRSLNGVIPSALEILLGVYRRAFAIGWVEALEALGRNRWLPLTLMMLSIIGVICWYLWRGEDGERTPTLGQFGTSLLVGFLLVIPSVGILIWFDFYNSGLWRLYLYVSLPAAIAMFGIVGIITSPIVDSQYRNAAITALCLIAILPGASRLLVQHELFVISAGNKARILQQIVQLAPDIGDQTRVLIFSEMSEEQFRQKQIDAMESPMVGHALYVVYEGKGAARGSICTSVPDCYPLHYRSEFLKDTIVFTLDGDLDLTLITEPSTFIDAYDKVEYDVAGLYSSDVPIPSRAFTMLGLSTR